MTNHKKFIIITLVIIILCAVGISCLMSISLVKIRTAESKTAYKVISLIKEKYPDITDTEIAEMLNSKTEANHSVDLSQYGISQQDWITEENEANSTRTALLSGIATVLFGLILLTAAELYHRSEKNGIVKLTGYLAKLNSGYSSPEIDTNTEDDRSLLKNEIYKTALMLRERSEYDRQAKENLKNSLSDISHQLKTPLTSIIIIVENLLDDPDMPPKLRSEFLQDIKQASGNISFLVQSLLTLSKLDAESIEMKIKPEQASDILKYCITATDIIADIHGVTVTAEDNGAVLNCDKRWFCEALKNITKNCIEHTPCGGAVHIECSNNKLYTCVTVTDNGCGIAKDDLPHIFERFYKGKNSDENSIGIGLALANKIIEKHSGYITVDSTEGKGSKFTIKIMNSAPVFSADTR